MSDAFLAELWASAPAPWNTLGPEISASLKRAARSQEPSRLVRWAHALRKEREDRGMAQREIAARSGILSERISDAERSVLGPNDSTWDKLAAFYGITLE